jgi:antitoxin (DNA-binding transcriptional repressor) of toxin-antitoxin stability system
MTAISIEEIQRDLESYLRKVEEGETLVIMRAGEPVSEIKPVAHGAKPLRPAGLCAGEFTVPDDFDDPLPARLLRHLAHALPPAV